ncbi:hypothetical protein P692DRAFT_201501912 [Suillus brevipes Sb2]|nr:hypothetical protein P692DRAFT_201501912 [Suillus brevipes Sb2]
MTKQLRLFNFTDEVLACISPSHCAMIRDRSHQVCSARFEMWPRCTSGSAGTLSSIGDCFETCQMT